MMKILDLIGNWNPQLFRELKGRLTWKKGAIALLLSAISQFVLVSLIFDKLPFLPDRYHTYYDEPHNRYCAGEWYESGRVHFPDFVDPYSRQECQPDALSGWLIDWQLWYHDLFFWISITMVVTLLLAGVFMVMNDLGQEERRGTLNFVRLSPQSAISIVIGKMLGVPTLLYVGIVAMLPLHLWTGLAAGIPLLHIFGFYGVVIAGLIFWYGFAALLSLKMMQIGGLTPWLVSGCLGILLIIQFNSGYFPEVWQWLNLFSPIAILPYIALENLPMPTSLWSMAEVYSLFQAHFAGIQFGHNGIWAMSMAIANFAVVSVFVEKALRRSFHIPTATWISKSDSYLLVAYINLMLLGYVAKTHHDLVYENFCLILFSNTILIGGLIAALCPHRQTVQDWARFRHLRRATKDDQGEELLKQRSLLRELLMGDRSPAILAIGINALIPLLVLTPWICLQFGYWIDNGFCSHSPVEYMDRWGAIAALFLHFSLMLFYATVVQQVLLIKSPKRSLWAIATLAAIVIVPCIILQIFSIDIDALPWRFTVAYWEFFYWDNLAISYFAVGLQVLSSIVCSVFMTRQIRKLGSSSSQAILAQPGSLIRST